MPEDIEMLANAVDPKNYTYDLPEECIAKYPAKERGKSKLLVYQNEGISHQNFEDITQYLPSNSHLIFNNTKVIPARILFRKETGALIEIFLLEPIMPSRIMSEAMSSTSETTWKCMVGNARKWKNNTALGRKININQQELEVKATWVDRENQEIKISWNQATYSFAEILQGTGQVPLPPYIDRGLNEQDPVRYQTVYSKIEGAVAAPTAGLHFTNEIIQNLETKNITTDEVTLHVSAGTFQPLKAENIMEHPMHSEQIVITKNNLKHLISNDFITAVGTTSLRTLESTYWYGVKLIQDQSAPFFIEKLYPYQFQSKSPSKKEAFNAVLNKMNSEGKEQLIGDTEIFIFPGYTFKVCDALITNFHLPGSTLILLIAAFIGENWRDIYQSALINDYKFLSYGDSSILIKEKTPQGNP